MVKKARDAIIQFPKIGGSPAASRDFSATGGSADKKGPALLEQERARMETLRRRQEKEMAKMIDREHALAELQDKIKKAEELEIHKRKLHEKKVEQQKSVAQKKQIQRQQELVRLEQEELARKRDIARRDAEFEAKVKQAALENEARLKHEAKLRDEARERKIEEFQKKTEDLIQAQFEAAERSRQIMMEREARVKAQLDEKKAKKKVEVAEQRAKAEERIRNALMAYMENERRKKEKFMKKRQEALERAEEIAKEEAQAQVKKGDARERNDKTRYHRLLDAYRTRSDYRADLSQRINAKNTGFDESLESNRQKAAMMKFQADLRMQEKQDNVERIARVSEFRRLQIARKIELDDDKYNEIQRQKQQMMEVHRQEVQQSLIRKHEVINAMELMRTTNDFTLLDKLFESKKKKGDDDRRQNDDDDVAERP